MENKRKIFSSSTLAMIGLILMFASASYAFLIKYWNEADTDIPLQVTTNTVDSLFLSVDADISIVATPDNYDVGMRTNVQTSTATALLHANNKTGKVVEHYYIYLDIFKNEFVYTSADETPELLMRVIDPEGNEVTDINGLVYKTVVDSSGETLSGFDITTKQNAVTIASYYEISTTSNKSESWKISLAFVNLATPQKDNTGKLLDAKILLQKDPLPLANVCLNTVLGRCIKENYTSDSNLYYHDSKLVNGAKDNSIRYAGSYDDVKNYVCFGDLDENGNCSHDNLYRIIGVFNDKLKLIKADYAKASELGTNNAYKAAYGATGGANKGSNSIDDIGAYYWSYNNTKSNNALSASYLQAYNLNQNYLRTFSTEWQNKISSTYWSVGGNNWSYIGQTDAPTTYQNEIVSPTTGQSSVNNKIGMMYLSDYMYGAAPEYWSYKGYAADSVDYRLAVDDNWLYNGLTEWTITRASNTSNQSIYVDYRGSLYTSVVYSGAYAVRPVFYLNADVVTTAGNGTLDDPFII